MSSCFSYLLLLVILLAELGGNLYVMRWLSQIPVYMSKRRWLTVVGIMIGFHSVIAMLFGVAFSYLFLTLSINIGEFFLFRNQRLRVVLLQIFMFFMCSIFDASVVVLTSFSCGMDEQSLLHNNVFLFLVNCIPVLALVFYRALRKKKHTTSFELLLENQQIVFMLIGAVGLWTLMGTIQLAGDSLVYAPIWLFHKINLAVVCLIFSGLIIWQGVVVSRKKQLDERVKFDDLYAEMREEHFKEIQLQDETLRRFRHDHRAHMLALKGYCEQGRIDEMEDYIDTILKTTEGQKIQTFTNAVGANAVISNLVTRAKGEGIEVDISGSLENTVGMTSFELCSVVSNILTNAIEACERVEEGRARRIELKVGNYNDKMYLHLENSRAKGETGLKTFKNDTRNHGLGMGNVRNILERYGGLLQCFEKK